MPTPSKERNPHLNLVVDEDINNQEPPNEALKSVAIEVPPNERDPEANVSNAELLAEIRRLTARLDAVEAMLESESSLEEDSNQPLALACEPERRSEEAAGPLAPVVQVASVPVEAKQVLQDAGSGLSPPPTRRLSVRKKEKFTQVRFEESAWSIPLVIGLADVGWLDTVGALLLIPVNLGMQIAFSSILLSEPFMGGSFDENLDSARVWRRTR